MPDGPHPSVAPSFLLNLAVRSVGDTGSHARVRLEPVRPIVLPGSIAGNFTRDSAPEAGSGLDTVTSVGQEIGGPNVVPSPASPRTIIVQPRSQPPTPDRAREGGSSEAKVLPQDRAEVKYHPDARTPRSGPEGDLGGTRRSGESAVQVHPAEQSIAGTRLPVGPRDTVPTPFQPPHLTDAHDTGEANQRERPTLSELRSTTTPVLSADSIRAGMPPGVVVPAVAVPVPLQTTAKRESERHPMPKQTKARVQPSDPRPSAAGTTITVPLEPRVSAASEPVLAAASGARRGPTWDVHIGSIEVRTTSPATKRTPEFRQNRSESRARPQGFAVYTAMRR